MSLETYNLHTNPDVHVVEYSCDEEWLELRKRGIGGSDVAATMGLSKYMSPLKLYKLKTGKFSEDLSDNVYIRKGKDLEPLIRDKYVVPYMNDRGYSVVHPDVMFVNGKCSWLQANLDGLAIPKDGRDYRSNIIVEIKWVSEYAEAHWNTDEYCGIPPHYYAQVQHYMTVTGARKAIVFAMFDSDWHVQPYVVPYDAGFSAKLLEASEQFYKNHMLKDTAPKASAALDKEELYEAATSMKIPVKSDELNDLCREYQCLIEQIKELEDSAENIKNSITELAVEGKYPSGPWTVSVVPRSTYRVDASRLKAEKPEVYQEYLKTTQYTMTTVRKKKMFH